MSEKTNLLENLKKLQEGNAWHGPSLREILASVTAEQAATHHPEGLHSIWELVLHIAAWEEVFSRRLQGQPADQPDEGDFPPVKRATPEAWIEAIQYLETAHQRLLDTISKLEESTLQDKVPGREYTIRFMLVGIIQHHVYHTGQMSMLKKLLKHR